MKVRAMVFALVGVCVFVGDVSAHHLDQNTVVRRGCTQNVRHKIKVGTVKKGDFDSELDKCITNSTTYQ